MRRIFFSWLLFTLSFLSIVPHAANAATPVSKSAVKTLAMSNDSASGKPELLNCRFAIHSDAVTGLAKLRLVVDVSGPVDVDATMSPFPEPRLVVEVKGASVGKMRDSMTLDGKIAEKVAFSSGTTGDSSRIVIDLPYPLDQDDYQVFTLPSDASLGKPNRIVIDINQVAPAADYKFSAGLKGKIIALDPGHGGSDPGAIGAGGTQEKTVTLAIAQKVQALLEKAGAKVLMTRRDDRDVFAPDASAVDELRARATVGNFNKADVFLSIHINSFQNRSVGGVASYYYKKSALDALLARNLQDELAAGSGMGDRGVSSAKFYVLKNTAMPASLVELGFISNPNEERLLNSPQFQQQLAQSIVQGLSDFFDQAAKMGGGQ